MQHTVCIVPLQTRQSLFVCLTSSNTPDLQYNSIQSILNITSQNYMIQFQLQKLLFRTLSKVIKFCYCQLDYFPCELGRLRQNYLYSLNMWFEIVGNFHLNRIYPCMYLCTYLINDNVINLLFTYTHLVCFLSYTLLLYFLSFFPHLFLLLLVLL